MATAETPQRKTGSKRSRRHPSPTSQPNADSTAPADNMAETAALTNGGSHRHHHHHHRHHHHHCNHGNQEQTEKLEKSKSKSRPTKQLDFDQAMADFKTMFPTMDCEIIEAVLRANDGAVDATIDQLLTMGIDSENTDPDFEIPPELLSPVSNMDQVVDDCPLYNEHRSEDSPPSYTEAVSNNIWTTPIPSQETVNKVPQRSHSVTSTPHKHSTPLFNHSFDELSLSNTEPKLPPPDVTETLPKKPGFRNWNPPMLGTLPDDFLRLVPQSGSPRSFLDDSCSMDFNEKPRVHHRRHKHSSSRSSSERKKLSQSLITDDFSSPRSNKLSRSMSERSPIEPLLRTRSSTSGLPLTSQSLIISSHEFTQGMLDKKMKENERRRRTAVMNADLEMSQYLEDERLAIMLQNSEFLQELRGNDEFMQTLERDQIKKKDKKDKKSVSPNRVDVSKSSDTAVKRPEVHEVPRLVPVPIEEETHEWLSPASEAAASEVRLSFNDDENVSIVGYGDDRQQELDAFPFSQPVQKDDDAELRRKLKDMGGASRTQFIALAKKFFSRKKSHKRTLKQIQKEKLAPSMLNLLDSEEEDYMPEDDKPYNRDTDIEPLPTSILKVPGHKYVQRPPYHPEAIVTYHDNHATDMV